MSQDNVELWRMKCQQSFFRILIFLRRLDILERPPIAYVKTPLERKDFNLKYGVRDDLSEQEKYC